MTVNTETGQHIPANSMLFQFDAEVALIFDNMARRSIVGYERAFEIIGYLVARMALPRYSQVWDMGTSTGKGLRAVRQGAGLHPYLDYWGCDVSVPMIEQAKKACGFANFVEHDLTTGFPEQLERGNVGIMIYAYTLQFIEDREARKRIIRDSYEALAPGGMLVVTEKYLIENPLLNSVMQDAYIEFRRNNGYSLCEIKAKTQALANAMWPETPDFMRNALYDAGFAPRDVHVLYRDMNFGGFVAFKPQEA